MDGKMKRKTKRRNYHKTNDWIHLSCDKFKRVYCEGCKRVLKINKFNKRDDYYRCKFCEKVEIENITK